MYTIDPYYIYYKILISIYIYIYIMAYHGIQFRILWQRNLKVKWEKLQRFQVSCIDKFMKFEIQKLFKHD